MKKRAQAAMEFLMTYGWAILVVLIAIGALAYFGVLDPGKFLPNRCSLPAGIACLDYLVEDFGPGNGEVSATLKNSLGYDTATVILTASGCTSASPTQPTFRNGEQRTFTASGCTVTSGQKYSGQINVTYTNADTGLTHKMQGSIIVRV